MASLPETDPRAIPFTAVTAGDQILLVSFAKRVWQFDPRTLDYHPISPLPEEVAVDRFFLFGDRVVGTGGENRIETPRNRSESTWIGRFSR